MIAMNTTMVRHEVVRHMREVSLWARARGMYFVADERLVVARRMELGASISLPQHRDAIKRLEQR